MGKERIVLGSNLSVLGSKIKAGTFVRQKEWQGLTDEEREEFSRWAHIDIIEDIETKLRERNT